MKRIFKWTVIVGGTDNQIGAGDVLHVDAAPGVADEVNVWTLEDYETAPLFRRAFVIPTGVQFEDANLEHVGTVVVSSVGLVWHVFIDPRQEHR